MEAVDLTGDTTLKNEPKKLKKQKLRNNEYYEMQSVFDELHAKSVQGKTFTDLMRIISCEDNILLAYRNIKNNDGSMTAGSDGRTIEHYKDWPEERFVKFFQDKLRNYHPKSVRRVEIPKNYQPGKTRPLGIPCMDDRIIQQCILQVLEPICEAKFHNHSYGFRPNRSTSHAIARTNFLMWHSYCHYVVDIDIKGFFDNVNHGKLLRQMWAMGIRDKNLISIIGRILKSEIRGIGIPDKGTPQGGIISPLLSNIVLNELDWWLSDQWETFETKRQYSMAGDKFRVIRKSNLKEFYVVRYADDFKILCKDYQTAQKIFIATRNWLSERLELEISPEKSKITNVRKGKTEFLGFALFVKKKKKKFVTRSHISEKAKTAIKVKLKEQIKAVQQDPTPRQVNLLNSMILGIHQYYEIATLCSSDFDEINFVVSKSLHNRLKGKTKKGKIRKKKSVREPPKSKTYQKFYGDYNQRPKIVAGIHLFPIFGCKFKAPMCFTQEINKYTEQGRTLIHSKLGSVKTLVRHLLKSKEYDKSVEYNDNRISLMTGQNGKCGVTGEPLIIGNMECHHKKPKESGGSDEYNNLMWIKTEIHRLIHATNPDTIGKYLTVLKLDEKALKKVNSLRLSAENLEIEATAI
jgi:group II intron reverse transcriptase/maturase